MVMSKRWPVPFQGSLVSSTSPSRSNSGGKTFRKCLTDSAIAFTWPGVPVTACAIIRPSGRNTPADRSPASRVAVPNAERISTWACSSTTDSSRFQASW
ncbi:hypothetical protein D9M72_286070 [compost metagenome]